MLSEHRVAKRIIRLVAAWAGFNAMFFASLVIPAALSERIQDSRMRVVVAIGLLCLAATGALACVRLWSLTVKGRNAARFYFGVLTLMYLVKIVLGPDRELVLLPLCLSMNALSMLWFANEGVWEQVGRHQGTES